MEEKSNTKLYVIIIVLSILVIVLGAYIIHNNVDKNPTPNSTPTPEVKELTKEEVVEYADEVVAYSGFAGLYKDGFKGNLTDITKEQKFAFAYTIGDDESVKEYKKMFNEEYPGAEIDAFNDKAAEGEDVSKVKLYPFYSNVFTKLVDYKFENNKYVLTYKHLYAFINFEESPSLYLLNIKGDVLYTGKNGDDPVLQKIAYEDNYDPEELLIQYDEKLNNVEFTFEVENEELVLKSINY